MELDCLRGPLGRRKLREQDEVGHVAEAVHNGKDDRLPVRSRQTSHEVHGNMGPGTGRHLKEEMTQQGLYTKVISDITIWAKYDYELC